MEDKCNNENCRDARIRLDKARTELMEACTSIKGQERTRNIHSGATTAAIVAAIAFMYKTVASGPINGLWVVAAGIAIALAISDSKSLIISQKKLSVLNDNYLDYLEEFKTSVNHVKEYCNTHCLHALDLTVPSC